MQSDLFIFILGVIPGVFSAPCKPPYVNFRFLEKSFIRRIPYIIEADVDRCAGLNVLYYKWSLAHSGNIVLDQTYRDFLLHGYKQIPYGTAFTSKTTLSVFVSHYKNFSARSQARVDIQFIHEPIHLEIVGGPKRIFPDDEYVSLDGLTFSYDPSFSPTEPNPVSKYDIVWVSHPPVDPKYLSTAHPKIPATDLQKNVAYNFTIIVTRDKANTSGFYHKASESQIVTIKRVSVQSGIELTCEYNCEKTNYKDVVVLAMICKYNCEELDDKWHWTIIPEISISKTQLGTGYNKLIINKYTFSPDSRVSVSARNGLHVDNTGLYYVPEIQLGNCYIEPQEGVSAVTVFKVTCEGFRSLSDIRRYYIYQIYGDKDPGIMIHYGEKLDKKEMFLAPGSPAILLVFVEDESFMRSMAKIELTVRSPIVRLGDLKVIVLGRSSYSLYSYWQKNLRSEMAQTVSCALEALKNITTIPVLERKKICVNIVKYVSFLEPRDFASVSQWSTVAEKIRLFYNNTFDTYTTRYLAQNTESMLNILQVIVINELEVLPRFAVENYLQTVFSELTLLLQPTEEIKKYLNITLAAHEYDTYDEMVHDRLEMRNNLRELAESCFRSFELIQDITMKFALVDEDEKSYETAVSGFISRKITAKKMPPFLTIRKLSNSRIHFPTKLRNFLGKTYSSISYYFVVFSYDPFWWHSNITEFSTQKFLCAIYHEQEKIRVVPTPFYVTLALKGSPATKIQGNVTDSTPFNISVHRIIIAPQVQVLAYFEATPQSFLARFSDCYCGPEDMKNAKLIAADSFERERVLYYETKLDVTFLCVERLGLADLHYVGWINSFECMYWDLERGNFQTGSIKVADYNMHPDGNLRCKAFHFSLFLGRAISPVHYVNTPEVIDFNIILSRNMHVVIFVGVLLGIWLILMHWAIYKDKEFAKKSVVCKLDDNVPGDEHVYLVVVFTGVFIDAGTTADVAIQIVGETSESRVHLIKCCNMSLLKRNSQDWFIIYTPEYLGPLKSIRLWHNCEGNEPHWYCQRIIVQHLESGRQYCFIVDDWLSLIWGSGKIYHEVQVTHWMEMKKWKLLFAINMENLKEEHLWVSVVGRQHRSSFNYKERVSTAIAAIFLSMLASAILFGFPRGVPLDSIDPQTKYFITPETIVIFTQSWLLSIPLIFFIIIIFKNSAP